MRDIKLFRIAQIAYFASLIIIHSIVFYNGIVLPEFWGMALMVYSVPAGVVLALGIGTGAFIVFCLVGAAIISVVTGENQFE